jgi:hypothetical protein
MSSSSSCTIDPIEIRLTRVTALVRFITRTMSTQLDSTTSITAIVLSIIISADTARAVVGSE